MSLMILLILIIVFSIASIYLEIEKRILKRENNRLKDELKNRGN